MTVSELFEYVDEIMENSFSEAVKRRWLNQIEAEIQVDVLLMAPEGIVRYGAEDMDAELIAPAPYDQLYQEYLFLQILLAQQETELYNNQTVVFNRVYLEYVRFVAETINPGNGIADKVRYYLTAYQIAVKLGYTGTETEWVASLKGEKGEPGAGIELKGRRESLEDLPKEPEERDAWLVGTADDNRLYIYENGEWADCGSMRGPRGPEGVGITEIRFKSKTAAGNVYTITLSNGNEQEFTAPPGSNGKKGNDGVGVAGISFKETTDVGNVYTIKLTNGETYDFTAPEGEPGKQGEPGVYYGPGESDDYEIEENQAEKYSLWVDPDGDETDGMVNSVNGKTGKVTMTASDVGADPAGTANGEVSAHNTSTAAHSDIRMLIQMLTTRLNALADSDDTTLDQMSELVAYIKSNKSLIDSITTNKVSVADIINDLTTNVADKPLSAAQGVKLKALIDDLQTALKQVTVEGAVLYNAAQSLTAEEQSQARENIGAQIADFVITMKSDEDGNLIPDKTWAEATEAYKAGRRLSCVYNSREYALDSFWEGEEAHFVHNSITDLTEQRIYFLLDGTAYWSTNKASTSTFPVASVNGQTGAVKLTASDVGAVPAPGTATVGQVVKVSAVDATSKPTAWEAVDFPSVPGTLPNPAALTFTGAVEATYDGSEAVIVEISKGGDNLVKADELIASGTIATGSSGIVETGMTWGQLKEYKEFALLIASVGGNTNFANNSSWRIRHRSDSNYYGLPALATFDTGTSGNITCVKFFNKEKTIYSFTNISDTAYAVRATKVFVNESMFNPTLSSGSKTFSGEIGYVDLSKTADGEVGDDAPVVVFVGSAETTCDYVWKAFGVWK